MRRNIGWIIVFLFHLSSFGQDKCWTFDCSMEDWGRFNHHREFIASHQLSDDFIPSGHIEFRHRQGETSNWFFSSTTEEVNADQLKHLHFSMKLEQAGNIPETGITGLFVWIVEGDVLKSKLFKFYPGHHLYHIDLSTEPDWQGNVRISRFHFPQSEDVQGYTPESAVYGLDWLAFTESDAFTPEAQDTDSSCIPAPIELAEEQAVVVNGTSMSVKTAMNAGNTASWKIIYQQAGEPAQTHEYASVENGPLYASLSLLGENTEYEYALVAQNSVSSDTLRGTFATESEKNYSLRGKKELWFTPSPFSEDVPGIFTGDGAAQWPRAAAKARSFHVRQDWIMPSGHHFDQINVPAMIWFLNAHGMTLSMENGGLIPANMEQGPEALGIASAQSLFIALDEIYQAGGKLDYLSPDGLIKRVTKVLVPEEQPHITMEEAFDASVAFFQEVRRKYPNIRIGYLTNFPNWDFFYDGTLHYGTNNGIFSYRTGYRFDQVLDEINTRLKAVGEKIAFVEVDNPYKPYYVKTEEPSRPGITFNNREMLKALEQYCHDNDMAYGLIFNSAAGGGTSNQAFYEETMDFLDVYCAEVGIPDFLNVESWYTYPDTNLPEDTPYTFMNLLKDFGSRLEQLKTETPAGFTHRNKEVIYPNPSDGTFKISGIKHPATIEIYTLSGRRVLTKGVPNNSPVHTGLPGGIYLIRVASVDSVLNGKIVIRDR